MTGKSIERDCFAQPELMPRTLGRPERRASVVSPDNHDTPVQSETNQGTEPTFWDSLFHLSAFALEWPLGYSATCGAKGIRRMNI